MLGTKEELGRGAFGVCLLAAGGKALLFHFARCPALPKITCNWRGFQEFPLCYQAAHTNNPKSREKSREKS